ncbi:MAG TPA: transcriptional regulator [Rhizobiales bacterium]|nr:transcriptional regulator [Hyphomicrobiales bacterium]
MIKSIQIKALAGETRLKILRLLAEPEIHFGDQWSADPVEFGVCMTLIADALGVAQPTASRHLDILKQAGFISVRKHMKWSYCKRDDAAIRDFLNQLGEEILLKNQAELCPSKEG